MELTQLAACTHDGESTYNQYILPDCAIDPFITRLTSLTVVTRHGQRVLMKTSAGQPRILDTVSAEKAFEGFLQWLERVFSKKKCKTSIVGAQQ